MNINEKGVATQASSVTLWILQHGAKGKYCKIATLTCFKRVVNSKTGFRCRFIKRATDEGSLPEIAQYSPYYLPLNVFAASKESNLYILFAITAAGVVPCGGPKKSPRTSSIVQNIFYLGPLRSVKIFRVFKTLTFRNILLSNV